MQETDFNALIAKGKYNFFICCSPAFFPFNCAKHIWIITSNQGEIHRREVAHFQNKSNPILGYLQKDVFKPRQGIYKFFRNKKRFYESKVLYHVSGDETSLAKRLVIFIENDIEKTYPRKHRYIAYPGPNSNTFIQRVIKNNPEIKVTLPRNAFGKNYV